jgi:uncharacterized protein
MRFLRILLLLTVCQFVVTNTTLCQTNHVTSQEQFWNNIPKPKGYINDYEHVFTFVEVTTLDSVIKDFEKQTTIQIAIVTLDTTRAVWADFDTLTIRIAKVWGVGQKGKDNGVTIGISKELRKIRIVNGLGIEKIMSDDETSVIIKNYFLPGYRQGKYFEGTMTGLKALMAILTKKQEQK